MEFKTIKGYSYVVTASTATTVTDSHGLNLQVAAGAQQGFIATGSAVNYTGDCTIVQLRGNFNLPSTGGGGGGQPSAPVPEPLGTTTTLLHGHVYTLAVAGDTDLSALGVELYGTAELWLDYTAGSVTWPTLWSWVDGIVPTFTAGTRYFVRVWSDGVAVISELKYSYTNA